MRNVERNAEPQSLSNNAYRWRRELLDEIANQGGNVSKVENRFFDKYNKQDVKEALNEMYDGLCCYCEGKTGTVDYPHIEHRKPKKLFPESTYDWNNLNLSCSMCNTKKGDKYSKKYPILDAVRDVPISKYLTYKVDRNGVWVIPMSNRGKTTREHADLDRDKLRGERAELCCAILTLILEIKKSEPENSKTQEAQRYLESMCRGEYGSVVEYLVKEHDVN